MAAKLLRKESGGVASDIYKQASLAGRLNMCLQEPFRY